MSIRGVRQLKEFVVRYSDYDGSSRHLRNWIRTDLIPLAEANPELSIRTEIKRCKHPYFRGVYANGNTKTIGVKNLEEADLTQYFTDLRNQVGKKVNQRKTKTTSHTPSIQGEWNERMDLINLELEVKHEY